MKKIVNVVLVTVIAMPIIVLPMMVLMNDRSLLNERHSGPIGNAVLATLVIAGALMAVVVVPLQILGGG